MGVAQPDQAGRTSNDERLEPSTAWCADFVEAAVDSTTPSPPAKTVDHVDAPFENSARDHALDRFGVMTSDTFSTVT